MLATHTTASADADAAVPALRRPPLWREVVAPVDPFLKLVAQRLAAQVEEFEPEIRPHARYALDTEGKQLRPALVGLSAEAVGRLGDPHVTVAVIIEMVHLATLVHDDVMDSAEVRRRRPTLAVRCGTTTSVLLGDILFAHALMLASAFPTTDVCRLVASATRTVCSGEIIQTERASRFDLGRDEYFRILRMKTGELFALSCELGARLAGAGTEEQAALREFGMSLGTAYQVFDDCVDLLGTESEAGKSLGTDLVGGKPTLPLIVALERLGPGQRQALEHQLARWQPSMRPGLLRTLRETGAVAEAVRVVRAYCRSAGEALDGLAPTAGRRALVATAEFLERETDALVADGGV